ncbi:MAG: DUF3817 domain-containing protein [Cryomorphaceae bacterium]|nr:MAG: DUF3817 domain-containing protein [Cryomorphaceae bacterium]
MDSSLFQPNARDRFRLVGILEGISFLLLLLIAMPLKYFMSMPLAVTYVGWAHGVLFVAYMLFLAKAWWMYKWSFTKIFLAVGAAFFPGGPFMLDSKIKQW